MQQLVEALSDLIEDHWLKFVTAVAFTGIGWFIAKRKAAQEWKQREFFHRVNFSLTTIRNGTLQIRTLAEKTCEDVFLNDEAVKQITAAAQQTRAGLPIIPLPQEDSWYFLNAVLNEVSEQFAAGLMARQAGKDVTAVSYLICLTNECDGEVRTRKIRALITQKELLVNLPDKAPNFESPHHRIRWETLLFMARAVSEEPWRFLEVEIVA